MKEFPVDLVQSTICRGCIIHLKTLDTVEELLNGSKTTDEPSKRLYGTEKVPEKVDTYDEASKEISS